MYHLLPRNIACDIGLFGCFPGQKSVIIRKSLLYYILLLVIHSIVSCICMEKTNNINSRDSRVHAYKNGKEQSKEEAGVY